MFLDFFSKPFFEKWLNQADPIVKEWFEKEIEYLEEEIEPGSKVLDVGCGFGRHMKIVAEFCGEIVGIDKNKKMVKKAQKKLSGFENVELYKQKAQNLDFEDNYFDYVICMTNTFGDFSEGKEEALREMKRVCKDEGLIVLSVYSDRALKVRKKNYEKVGLHIEKIEDGTVYTKEGLVSEQFNKQELKTMFERLGLESNITEPNKISFLCKLEQE